MIDAATPDVSQKNRLKCSYYEQANRYFYGGENGGGSESVCRKRSGRANKAGGATSLGGGAPVLEGGGKKGRVWGYPWGVEKRPRCLEKGQGTGRVLQ